MIQIVAFIGLTTASILLVSVLYHKARGEFQPKWWYGMAAICLVCHFILAFLFYEEHPIPAIVLFACACGLSYIACRIAIFHDRIQKR